LKELGTDGKENGVNKQGHDWRNIETQIIQKSKIICCTLSLSGQEKLDIIKD
jgi:hypothetical protein